MINFCCLKCRLCIKGIHSGSPHTAHCRSNRIGLSPGSSSACTGNQLSRFLNSRCMNNREFRCCTPSNYRDTSSKNCSSLTHSTPICTYTVLIHFYTLKHTESSWLRIRIRRRMGDIWRIYCWSRRRRCCICMHWTHFWCYSLMPHTRCRECHSDSLRSGQDTSDNDLNLLLRSYQYCSCTGLSDFCWHRQPGRTWDTHIDPWASYSSESTFQDTITLAVLVGTVRGWLSCRLAWEGKNNVRNDGYRIEII